MTRETLAPLAFAVVLAFLVGACSRSPAAAGGSDPSARLLAHTDRMIELLRANEADPEKAASALAAYQAKHGAEVEELKRAMAAFMQKDPLKAAAAASVYGRKSTELAHLTAQAEARARTRAR